VRGAVGGIQRKVHAWGDKSGKFGVYGVEG
jgi:hypothetical protein